MPNSRLTYRLARRDDLDALKVLMDTAISELQKPFLDESQIASSRAIMGLDTQLFVPYEEIIDDRGGAGVPLLRMRKSL